MIHLRILKILLVLTGFCVGISSFADAPTPLIVYSFEHQKPADDTQTYVGSLIGNAAIVPMTDGNHALYTGAGYMDLTAAMGKAILAQLTGNYSISIDLCVTANNNLAHFSWAYAFANGTSQYIGLVNTAGNGNWYYEIKNSGTSNAKSNVGLTTNVWHQLTMIQNGSLTQIYVDGVLRGSASNTMKPSAFASTLKNCALGWSPFSGDAIMTNTFMDNFKIYNVALSAEEIAAQYNAIKDKATTTDASITTNIAHVWEATGNPIVTHKYTADPAALVYNDTLFIFTGQDARGGQTGYNIPNWCCFATTDMKHFWEYSTPLKSSDFAWASANSAWAGQVIERNGKFYWYTSSNTTGIGVGIADRPEGPYKDALGHALVTNNNSPGMGHSWRTIDPSVFIDDDGQAWLYWGNGATWVAKLNEDMISIDPAYGTKMVTINGQFDFPFTEAPWVHKKGNMYYLSFAIGFPERIAYAISTRPDGPYAYKGIINEIAGNSNTNHQAILEYKGNWYFIYHNGGIQTDGGSFSRSVCIDKIEFDEYNMYKPVQMTTKGVDMIVAPDLNAIQEISTKASCPFQYDKDRLTITLKEGNRFSVVDSIGRVMQAGYGKQVSVASFNQGIYIISNGMSSYKFIR